MPVMTAYIATAGTPLKTGGTSLAGHMWYSIDDGIAPLSYGFQGNVIPSDNIGERKLRAIINEVETRNAVDPPACLSTVTPRKAAATRRRLSVEESFSFRFAGMGCLLPDES
jgi:hypothetical protein